MSRKRRRAPRPERGSAEREPRGRGGGRDPGTDGLPAWAPFALYGAVTLILFREFIVSGEMLFGTDTVAMGYMARAFYADALRELGTFPLWNPFLFGGTPFLESLAGGDSLYPLSAPLLLVMETYRALGWKLVLHVFLAGLFMYGWVRSIGVSRPAALVAGLAYLLAPYMVTLVYPGHDGKLFVTALTPLLFWAAERTLESRRALPFAALGGVVALVILTTHFQMAYFLFGGVGIYYIVRAVLLARGGPGWRPALARFGLFLGAAVVGAGAAGVQLLPAVEYVTDFSRRAAHTVEVTGEEAVAYSSSWSLHPEEVVALVVPEFVGNSAGGAEWTEGTYWGRNPFKLNHEYVGILVLLLAGVAFMGGARPDVRWPLFGIAVTALLFALGTHTPVWRLFFEVVPGIRLFRAPSMAVFLTGFAAATLMALGMDRAVAVAREGKEGEWRRLATYLGGFVGALALLAVLAATGVLTSVWTAVVYSDLPEQGREALARAEPFIVRGFFLSTLLAGAGAAGWWALRRGYLAPAGALALTGLLVVVDQGRVNDPFIQIQDYHEFAAPDENVRFLQRRYEEEGPFRVFSMFQGGEDVEPAMHGVEVAAGHHPNDIGRYRDILGMEPGGPPRELLRFNHNAYDLANVRYILWPDFQFGSLEGVEPASRVTLPDGRVYASVYPYPSGPRARVVGDAVVEGDGEAAVDLLLDPGFDTERQVVLPEEPPVTLPGGEVNAEVEWLERELNRQRLRVELDRPGVLVILENWFPAWRARANGEEVPVLRANHTFRGIPLEGGSHEVEVFYRSSLLGWSLVVSLICLVALGGTAAGSAARSRRERAGGPGE